MIQTFVSIDYKRMYSIILEYYYGRSTTKNRKVVYGSTDEASAMIFWNKGNYRNARDILLQHLVEKNKNVRSSGRFPWITGTSEVKHNKIKKANPHYDPEKDYEGFQQWYCVSSPHNLGVGRDAELMYLGFIRQQNAGRH